jgi:phage/conjugal plasmid C-4 type zinc finger TraR family protein
MADDLDRAAEYEALRLKVALENHFAQARDMAEADGDGICIDCGEPIPEARQRALPGCRRCIECQQRYESRINGR